MRSMTAFGQAAGPVEGRQLLVEVRCLNHRYCEVRLQGLGGWGETELVLERRLQAWARHGRVDCAVRPVEGGSLAGWPVLDGELARAYVQCFEQLAHLLPEGEGQRQPTLSLLAQAPGVIGLRSGPQDQRKAQEQLLELLERALEEADCMRCREGRRLREELVERSAELGRLLEGLRQRLPAESEHLRRQAAERLRELAAGVTVEPGRLEQELALLAEKCDVHEELVRLDSHRRQFDRLLEQDGEPAGKQLDFLLQEMGREINTLTGKTRSAPLVHEALALRAEIERMREQAQNVW